MTDEHPSPPPAISFSIDAYAPRQIAERVENAGVNKATLPGLQTLTLGVLAGAFIAFGGMLYTLAIKGTGLGFGPERLFGGIAFSLGLILVVIAGAELFTGNNLIVMAWADKRITTHALLRNWLLVYVGNFVGSVATAVMVHASGILSAGGGAVGATAGAIAMAKLDLPLFDAFVRGVLCNVLVCLAVWMCFAAHSVTGKVVVIVFPISAFVALGFEHSVANMYLIPVGLLNSANVVWDQAVTGAIANLAVVTAGNILGGSVLVALVYWIIYLRRN
jgi:formate/nitrite transporter